MNEAPPAPSTEATTTAARQPFTPPFSTPSSLAVGGRLGGEPEHFIVDELPLYEPSGEGAHLYVRVRKRSLTTAQVARMLSKASGVRDREIGYAGLKDKNAVTTQWFSFPNLDAAAAEGWQLPEGLEVIETSRHNNKLRTGHLWGNRFRITLLEVERPELGAAIVSTLTSTGLPNYFGKQRFGIAGDNLDQAFEWLASGRRAKSRFLAKLYPSVIQSELFNRYLAFRTDAGLDRLIQGEVVRLEGSGKMFEVEDPAAEHERLVTHDIHLTGPIVGPKMKAATGPALELERAAAAEVGLDAALSERLFSKAPGTRRDLIAYATGLTFESPEPGTAVLDFSLPSGAYATQLVAEFTRAR
jgi:tRNA pseudouridine13 synthase